MTYILTFLGCVLCFTFAGCFLSLAQDSIHNPRIRTTYWTAATLFFAAGWVMGVLSFVLFPL